MSIIPGRILKNLFNNSSLKNANGKVCFSIKNRLSPATLLAISRIEINGVEVPLGRVNVACDDHSAMPM